MRAILAALFFATALVSPAAADHIAEVTTESWCVQCNRISLDSYKDPRVSGVACWMSRGVNGSWNPLSDDPSDATIACRQVGPIKVDLKELKRNDNEEVFSQKTSVLFKSLTARRFVDIPNNTIVYLLTPGDLTKGSTKNSNSPVPIMPWPEVAK